MNIISKTILTIILALLPFTASAGPLQDEILRISPNYIGIRETLGPNKGPEVNKILARAGLAPGNPWCMSLVYTMHDDAYNNLKQKNVLPKTGSSATYWIYASKHPLTFKVTPASQVLLGAKINPAATGIFKVGAYRKDGTFAGHADIVIKQIDKKSYKGIDGNTTDPKSKGQEWEGGASAYKTRSLGVPSFLVMGFIDVRD